MSALTLACVFPSRTLARSVISATCSLRPSGVPYLDYWSTLADWNRRLWGPERHTTLGAPLEVKGGFLKFNCVEGALHLLLVPGSRRWWKGKVRKCFHV